VSSVDGSVSAVVAGLAAPDALTDVSLHPTARDAADGVVGDPFGLSAAFDTDRYVLESGFLASPQSLDFENDYMVGDSSAFLSTTSALELFDIGEYIHDEAHAGIATDANAAHGSAVASDPEFAAFGLPDPETQVSSENINLQPQSGASAYGCDDGGIAVGV
jgi:transcriptional activator HAC1